MALKSLKLWLLLQSIKKSKAAASVWPATEGTVGSGDITGHQHFHFPSVMKTEALSGLRRGRSGNKREDLQAWQLRWGREGRTTGFGRTQSLPQKLMPGCNFNTVFTTGDGHRGSRRASSERTQSAGLVAQASSPGVGYFRLLRHPGKLVSSHLGTKAGGLSMHFRPA